MHEYFHTRFGFCMWDAGALILLAVAVIVLAVHMVRQKKRERDFEAELADKMARSATEHDDKD